MNNFEIDFLAYKSHIEIIQNKKITEKEFLKRFLILGLKIKRNSIFY
jgi:hypothetical protein